MLSSDYKWRPKEPQTGNQELDLSISTGTHIQHSNLHSGGIVATFCNQVPHHHPTTSITVVGFSMRDDPDSQFWSDRMKPLFCESIESMITLEYYCHWQVYEISTKVQDVLCMDQLDPNDSSWSLP